MCSAKAFSLSFFFFLFAAPDIFPICASDIRALKCVDFIHFPKGEYTRKRSKLRHKQFSKSLPFYRRCFRFFRF
jgi:hypothetical protein